MRAWLCLIAIAACQGSSSSPPNNSCEGSAVAAEGSAVETDGDVVRTTSSGAVTYTYRASKMTYLVYALDCLAELVPCSLPEINGEWKNSGWSTDDDEALQTWSELRRRYWGEIVDQRKQPRSMLPVAYHPRDIGTAIRVASFGARDVDDAASRLSLFLGASEVAQAKAALSRFSARADEKWRSARPGVVTSLGDYVGLGERADVQALLGQIATFFAIGDAGAHQTFDLVLRPEGKGPTSAQQLGELAVVEVVAGESAANRYSVIAHEMFHAWFGASPIDAQTKLVDAFIATGDPLAGPAAGLLDEVVATALGNGLVAKLVDPKDYERRLAKDKGFYNDPFIDKVAKALLPALEKRLANKGTIFDASFVGEYFAAIHAAFPDGMPPIAYLRPLFVPLGGPSSAELIRVTNAGYVESFDNLEEAAGRAHRLTNWGTAIFSPKKDLDRLTLFVPASVIQSAKREPAKNFVYAWKRKPVGVVFLFVGDDNIELSRLVKQFSELPAPLQEGVILR